MTLDDEDIEQIARRVAEVVGATHAHSGPQYVDASDLARILGVERDWIYANARRLGAVRLTEPRGRLRFDLRQVDEVLSPPEPEARPTRRAPARQRSSRVERTEVIQYER
jgi:hypothetical protein